MEDIIPMLIFVLIVTKVKELKNELDMMVDFIGFDPCDLESERRLLVNLSVLLLRYRNLTTMLPATGSLSDLPSVIHSNLVLISQTNLTKTNSRNLDPKNLCLIS